MLSRLSLLVLTLLLLLVAFASAASVQQRVRRDNTYGDEAVTPATGGASAAPMAAEVAPATVAPEGGGAQSNVESSGYRKKRGSAQNSYGDEATAPAGGGAPVVVEVSEAPAVTVEQAGGSQSAVSSSGY